MSTMKVIGGSFVGSLVLTVGAFAALIALGKSKKKKSYEKLPPPSEDCSNQTDTSWLTKESLEEAVQVTPESGTIVAVDLNELRPSNTGINLGRMPAGASLSVLFLNTSANCRNVVETELEELADEEAIGVQPAPGGVVVWHNAPDDDGYVDAYFFPRVYGSVAIVTSDGSTAHVLFLELLDSRELPPVDPVDPDGLGEGVGDVKQLMRTSWWPSVVASRELTSWSASSIAEHYNLDVEAVTRFIEDYITGLGNAAPLLGYAASQDFNCSALTQSLGTPAMYYQSSWERKYKYITKKNKSKSRQEKLFKQLFPTIKPYQFADAWAKGARATAAGWYFEGPSPGPTGTILGDIGSEPFGRALATVFYAKKKYYDDNKFKGAEEFDAMDYVNYCLHAWTTMQSICKS